MKKRIVSFLVLALALLLCASAFADVRQLGAGLTEADVQALTKAIKTIEETWMNRETSVQVTFTLSDKSLLSKPDELGFDLYHLAGRADNGVPAGPRYQRLHVDVSYYPAVTWQGNKVTLDYSFSYRTSPEQEQAVEAWIQQGMLELGITEVTEPVRRIQLIHDHICKHVTYDDEHYKDLSYAPQYTAHAAALDGIAVCQGYASLFNRFLISAGIDAEIVLGIAGGEYHSWNKVKLEGKEFYIDITWNDSMNTNFYFMATEEFADHVERDYTIGDMMGDDGFQYTIVNDTVEITGYVGSDTHVAIPAYINGLPVTSIAPYAFFGQTQRTKIALPDTLITIGDSAFEDCSGLTGGLIFPDSVTSIGNRAYYCCSGLYGTVKLPASLVTIGDSAFATRTTGLHGPLNIPGHVESIGAGAFLGCSFDSLTLPEGLKTIGDNAFAWNEKIACDLVIPSTVKSIGTRAFMVCSQLTGSIVIPEGVTEIGERTFSNCFNITGTLTLPSTLTVIGPYAFEACLKLSGELRIPEGVTEIGECAFTSCRSLTGAVEIPATVKSVGAMALSACKGIESVTVYPATQLIGNMAFDMLNPEQEPFTIRACPDSAAMAYARKNGHPVVELDPAMLTAEQLATIDLNAFDPVLLTPADVVYSLTESGDGSSAACVDWYHGSARQIIIPDTLDGYPVTVIGSSAFIERSDIEYIQLPATLQRIEDNAFSGCSSWRNPLVIPDGVTYIGDCAFWGCSSLTGDIRFPSGLTYLGDRAFVSCPNLMGTPVFPETLTYIGSYALAGCSGMSGTVIVPDNVTQVGEDAFINFNGEIILPANVEIVPQRDLGAPQTEQPVIPDPLLPTAVEELDWRVQEDTQGNPYVEITGYTGDEMRQLVIPAQIEGMPVTAIADMAFDGFDRNGNLLAGEIILPDTITRIGERAFNECYYISGALRLPDSVLTIGGNAFSNCKSLSGTLTLPANLQSIGSYAFNGTCFTGELIIPDSVMSVGNQAFEACFTLEAVRLSASMTRLEPYVFNNGWALKRVVIPQADIAINEGVFNACHDALTLYAPEGSTAQVYAQENGINFLPLE
ncbi:MAG TPA: leucine-rich repeat protein [Clostridiales bacterium]|jgi:hypothetical protein|nr:leucine-rich repeat protein [Clostridiales bacterium]